MPSIAVMTCSDCGEMSQRTLRFGEKIPVVEACSCGGRRRIARFFRDRRRAERPVPADRRGAFA